MKWLFKAFFYLLAIATVRLVAHHLFFNDEPIQNNKYQDTSRTERVNSTSRQKSSAERIYDNTIRSVMWIVTPGVGQGSGVLISKEHRVAVTNAHVTGTKRNVDVYFPAADENEKLIKDREFYKRNREVLKQLGYYTRGQVIMRNAETDLAIIRLEGLPETAKKIEFNGRGAKKGDLVYILGNPSGQELWRWTLGEYLRDGGDFLHIQSAVFPGNSGGPVLSKKGALLGIITRSDSHINALAIPVRDIYRLISAPD